MTLQDKILGDYKVLKQIGQGSLGTVFLAEHRFIKKPYILKLLPEELNGDRGFVTRFEEEVNKLAQLDHPHIVCFAEGVYFLVTDCIVDAIGETTNLAQYMSGRKERLREEELFSLLFQIADALDYAHERPEPMIHRTLKLNNILVGKGKPGIRAYISDFGLSKIIGAGAVVGRCFKATAEALGGVQLNSISKNGEEKYCPLPLETGKLTKLSQSFIQNHAFLAPEQKKMEKVTVATDSYAFGILTYYLLSGHFPEGLFEMPSSLVPEFQYDWDQVIRMTLARNPEKRRRDLKALLQECSSGKSAVVEEKPPMQVLSTVEPTLNRIITKEVEPVAVLEPVLVEVTEAPILEPAKKEPILKEYSPEKKEARHHEPLSTEMVVIPGGENMRGSNEGARDEMPKHQIYLDSFAIDIHPVTNEQFVRFLEYMGGEKDENHDLIRLKDSRLGRSAGKLSIETGYSKHPVVGVTWYGAMAYCKWIGKRLPTEAEWEIASLGGGLGPYPTGETIEKNQANFFSSDTTAVMSYAPNGYGLYDLSGNVYEWCQDWYGYNYYEQSALEPKNPKGPVQGVYRVLRGGCWKSLKEDLRSSHRHRNNPGAVNGTYGFRCASDL
jgi:formylglycine-generating enzyme required for sulfatase activity